MAGPRGRELISSEQIMKTAEILLRNFILDQIGSMAGPLLERVLGPLSQDSSIRKLVDVMRRITRELDRDKKLQRLIAKNEACTAVLFLKVADQIFADGNLNWGRVVALFCFATKLVLKTRDWPQLITSIMNWTLDYLQKRLLGWIQDQGGWVWSIMYFLTCLMNLIHLEGLLLQYGHRFPWLTMAIIIIGVGALALFRLRRSRAEALWTGPLPFQSK